MSSKTVCKNCERSFNADYQFCPYCGQENRNQPLKFKDFIFEYLSANFNLDSKFILTLRTLIFKPALLTKEILNGKRTKYVTPVRLYLLISLVYFFLISFENDTDTIVIKNKESQENTFNINSEVSKPEKLTGFKKVIYNKVKLLESGQGKREFMRLFKKSISMGMFIFMPLTAWILYLFFRKRYNYYIPHLIFTIHFQTLIFLTISVFTLIRFLIDYDIIFIIELTILIYLAYKWIKNFYGLTSKRTIINMIFLSGVYTFLSLLFIMVISTISFYLF